MRSHITTVELSHCQERHISVAVIWQADISCCNVAVSKGDRVTYCSLFVCPFIGSVRDPMPRTRNS